MHIVLAFVKQGEAFKVLQMCKAHEMRNCQMELYCEQEEKTHSKERVQLKQRNKP